MRFETEQAGVCRMAGFLPIEALTIAQLVKHVALTTDADEQFDSPTTIINTINAPLAVIEQSSRLTIKAMKLKDQPPQGINPRLGIFSKGAVASITGLVVMNDREQQTHRPVQPTAA